MESPIIWKELLMKGSKPFLIGCATDFWDYCHSFYNFETFLSRDMLDTLSKNIAQFKNKIINENQALALIEKQAIPIPELASSNQTEEPIKKNFVICISGARHPLVMHLISGLLELSAGSDKNISKIYIYDTECSEKFMHYVERDCSFVETENPTRVVKFIDKIGLALTHTDILIIMDHVPLG